jgi:hypothetical protein
MRPGPSNKATAPSSSNARRAWLEAALTRAVQLLADEELDLLLIARRLCTGQSQYGPFDLAHDKRDFQLEALEEACDLAVYLAVVVHQSRQNGRRRHRRRLEAEAAS